MKSGSKKEWLICFAIAIAGLVIGVALGRPSATVEAPEAPRPGKPLGSAILSSPNFAKVRPLLNGNADYLKIWSALDGCDNGQFEKLLDYSMTQPDGYYNAQLIVARWCEHDPAAATAAAARHSQYPAMFLAAIETWGGSDPHAAIDFLSEIPSNQRVQSAYFAVLGLIREQNPGMLPGLFEKIPGEHPHVRLSYEFQALADKDPRAAIQQLLDQRVPAVRYDSERDWKAWTGKLLAHRWIEKTNAREVLSFYDSDMARILGGVPDSVVNKLYEEDPQEALDWINDPASPMRVAKYGFRLASSLSKSEPDQAAAILISLPESKNRSRELQSLVGEWFKSDEGAARAWVDNLQDEQIRTQVRASIEATEGETE